MRRLFGVSVLSVSVVIAATMTWSFIKSEDHELPDDLVTFSLKARPQSNRHLFDYARVLEHYEEGAHSYLKRLGSRFNIEALIVSVPNLPEGHTIETLAVDLVNDWRIGAQHEARGLLLLLVDEGKQVKLEVGYALEDVFTDSVSGYVEDLQLGPYYRAGDVGTGLIAVMEMLEARAQTKDQGNYTPATIAQADAELLAGGAGAKRDLARYQEDQSLSARPPSGRGARSPEEAWEVMLAKWAGEGEDIDVDVYTEMTRLAMGDANNPDPRTLKWLDHWRNADYQVLSDRDHAVIWFGDVDGWENSPFLFCNTGDGWKFDIVWQRRLVVMAENPKWQVMQGPYPYVALMHKAWQSTAKDLPLGSEDLYRCKDDPGIAGRINELERALDKNPQVAAVIELLRLSANTNRRPNVVQPLIRRAKHLASESAETYKYSALYNVTAFFQYRTALEDIERYIELRPEDPYGYDVKGFLLYRLGKYQDSIDALHRAVALDADDGYAFMIMARDYAMLAVKATGLDKERYKRQALAMRKSAGRQPLPNSQRLAWLDGWLKRRL